VNPDPDLHRVEIYEDPDPDLGFEIFADPDPDPGLGLDFSQN